MKTDKKINTSVCYIHFSEYQNQASQINNKKIARFVIYVTVYRMGITLLTLRYLCISTR